MSEVSDVATEARVIISGFEARNISNPWFAAKALIFTAAWLIGDLSRDEADHTQHVANLRAILETCAKARFEQTHFVRN